MRGGAEMVVKRIFDELKEKNMDAFVITTTPTEDRKEDDVYFLNSAFHRLNKIPFVLRFFYHIWDSFNFVNYFKIKKILGKEKPDIVMTHALKGIGFLIPNLLRRLKIKHVHTLHDIQLIHPSGLMFYKKEWIANTPHAKIYQMINKYLFGSPDLIISPSSWLMEMMRSRNFFPNSKKVILPNPISLPVEKKEFSGEKNKFIFINVGQIEEHKGIPFLVDSFIRLLKEDLKREIELLIIGSGSRVEELKKIASSYEEIKILGRKPNKEVLEIMKKSDCLVVPSFCYENSPTTIYEANKIGLPTIASRLGGIPELIDKKDDFLFEPKSQEDLISKMKFVINLPKEGVAGKEEEKSAQKDYIEEIISLLA